VRLIDRWIRRDAGYWEGMATGASVLTTSYGSPDREAIMPSLAAWAQQAYGSSSPVFSVILARLALFSEARLQLQALDDKHLFGNRSLSILEHPWPDGSTGELLVRNEQDACLAGQSYTWAPPGEDRLVRRRPDWMTIVSELVAVDGGGHYRRKIGYWYEPPKSVLGQGQGEFYPAEEVAHWAPIPDPAADFRGMSWLTPIYRDIAGDDGLTRYKIKYLENSASPNLLIRYAQKLHPGTVDAVRERMHARYGGVDNAFKTLVLDQGADITVIGNSLQQMDFSNVEAAGEQRILSASGVPGVLVGLEPLRGAGRGYQESMQKFANLWGRPQWRSWCAAHSKLVDPPAGNRLWYDTSDIAALQDGELERGQAALVRGQALLTCRQAGATLESSVAFINSGDVTKLQRDPAAALPAGGNVQHQLPQQSPGVVASPLPKSQQALPVGSTSPGDGGNNTRPTPQLASARRAEIEAPPADDPDEDDVQDGDELDLDDLLADAEAPVADAVAERFNMTHAPAGSAHGGQFASSSSPGGNGAKAAAPKGHAAAATATAVAPHGGHARERRELEAKAAADREQARRLEEQLHVLVHQMRVSVAAHKKAAAAAKANAHHKATAAHHRKTARHHHRHARSLHSRVSALRTRIRGLLTQARSLDAKAKAL
jgi:hypothetical protein